MLADQLREEGVDGVDIEVVPAWRMSESQFDALPVKRLLEMTTTHGRV